MFSKTNLISTLAATIWGYFGGYLLWGIIGDSLMADYSGSATGVMKVAVDHLHLLLGCLILAFAFSTIYSKWARGAHSVSQGVQFGIWMAILIGLGEGLIDFGTSNLLNITGTFLNTVIYLVHFVIMGAIVSVVYNKLSTKE